MSAAFQALGVIDTLEMKLAQLAVALRQRHWDLAVTLADEIRAEAGDLVGYAGKLRAYEDERMQCLAPTHPCSCGDCSHAMRSERIAFAETLMARR